MRKKNEIDIIHSISNSSSSLHVSEYSGLDVLEYSCECPTELMYHIAEAYVELIKLYEIPEFLDICCECIDYFYGLCLEDTEHGMEDIYDEYVYDMYIYPLMEEGYYELFEDLVRDGLDKLKLTYEEECIKSCFGSYFDEFNKFTSIRNDAQMELSIYNGLRRI